MAIDFLPAPFGTPFIDVQRGEISDPWQRYLLALEQALSGAVAPANAAYLVAQADAGLTNEVNLGALPSGFLSIAVALGVATVSSSPTITASVLTGALPALNAAALTALNASALASGTVPQARKWAQATSALTGGQNNVNFSDADSLIWTNAGGTTVTGFAAGVPGQVLTNWATGAATVTLNNLDGGSTAPNQIVTGTGGAVVLTAATGCGVLQYDGGASKWRLGYRA